MSMLQALYDVVAIFFHLAPPGLVKKACSSIVFNILKVHCLVPMIHVLWFNFYFPLFFTHYHYHTQNQRKI